MTFSPEIDHATPLNMIQINNMAYQIAGRTLYENTTISIPEGQKVGLVGKNGSGKTTLFRLILGDLSPDQGAIHINPKYKIGTVAQEAPADSRSLLDTVLSADLERETLLEEAKMATDPTRISEIHIRLADIDAESAPARAAIILSGLGFPENTHLRACSEFSGGWRMRIALAATLFANPDILLLDEPTNHLDIEAVIWLEHFLERWRGTLVIISHERTLLNSSVDHIIHLENQQLVRYTGGYDFFEKTRREKLTLQSKMATKQTAERQRIQAFIDRFKAKANKARQAQSRIKMLERMEPIKSVVEEKTISFQFPHPSPLSPPLIAVNKTSVGYDENNIVLSDVDVRVDMDDRIALIGANGNGKSTMMKMLSGRLKPMTGNIVKSKKLKIGYFAQHQSEELNPDQSAFEHILEHRPKDAPTRLRGHLGSFGFIQERAETKVKNLSGGEKARLLFALMSLETPHIMLLDEPTNHLDIDSREALVEALNIYEGAVILVSHDIHLVRLVADSLWLIDKGSCKIFDGDLSEYQKYLLDERSTHKNDNKINIKPSLSKKEQRRIRADERQKKADLKRALKDSEKRITYLTEEINALELKMSNPSFFENSSKIIAETQKDLNNTKKMLAETESDWLELQDGLE